MSIILFLIDQFPVPTETFIYNEIEFLINKGLNIKVVAIKKTKSYNTIKRKFKPDIYLNSKFLAPRITFMILSEAVRQRKKTYDKYYFASIKQILKKIKSRMTGKILELYCLQHKIGHIHAHFASYPAELVMEVSRNSNIPFSFSAHSHDIYTQTKEKLANKIEKAKFVITCTRYNFDYLTSISREIQDSLKIHCIYHGINSDEWKFSPQLTKNDKDSSVNILTIARLVEKKGLFFLIEAIEILIKRNYSVNCTIIGSGSLFQRLNKLIVSKNITQYITILSGQTPKEIAQCFHKNDFFVLPSIIASNGDRDGLPNVLLEALASGIPVITTPVSAIPELIQDNVTGFFVPEKNSVAIADTICHLIEQQELCRTVAFNGMQKLKAEFDTSFWGDCLYQLFISELITVD